MTFVPRQLPAPDVASYISTTFQSPSWHCRGEAILHAPAAHVARWVDERGFVEELGPDRCRVVVASWSWTGLAAWLGLFEVDLEIIGPDELRVAAQQLARRYESA